MVKYYLPIKFGSKYIVVEYDIPDYPPYSGETFGNTTITLSADTSALPSGYAFVDWNNSLLGWWRGDSLTNLSNNVPRLCRYTSNDLLIAGTMHYNDNGPYGKSFNMASGYLYVDDTSVGILNEDAWNMDKYNSFTWAGWTKGNYVVGNTINIMWKGTKALFYYHAAGRWQYWLDASWTDNYTGNYGLFDDVLHSGIWTHFAVTYDHLAKKSYVYIDGTRRITLNLDNQEDFAVGNAIGFNSSHMSDILIFNRCLPSGEIVFLKDGLSSDFTASISNCEYLKEYPYTIYHVDYSGNITNYGNQTIRVVVPSSVPLVTLNYPINGARSENSIRTFNFTAVRTGLDATLSSAQLWWDYGGSHHMEASQSLSGTSGDYSFNIAGITTSGDYRWNCYVTDSAGYGGFASNSGLFKVGQSTYYVATSGSNSNPGTIISPYLTIQKFGDIAYPGDTCYIRGGTYRETVIPARSGLLACPITFNNYPGETVKITGADILSSGWVLYSGNIYTTDMTWTLGSGNNQVFVGDTAILEARYPKSAEHYWQATYYGDPHQLVYVSGYMASWDLTLYHYGSGLNQVDNFWVGATVRGNWDYKGWSGTVLSSKSGEITARGHMDPSRYTRPGVSNFYIAGDCLNALGYSGIYVNNSGEFYYNESSKKLYFVAPNYVHPSSIVVEAKTRRYGFDFRAKSYINVSGINLFGCNVMTSEESDYICLDHINAKYLSHFIWLGKVFEPGEFLHVNSSPGPTTYGDTKGNRTTGLVLLGKNNRISNSNIDWSCGDGIRLLQSNSSILNCNISNCNYSIVQCANINMWNQRQQVYNVVISGCTLTNGGTTLMDLGNFKNSKIIYNLFYGTRYSNEADDLGAIYSSVSCGGKYGRTEIAYNTFSGIRECGIYLDAYSWYYHIHHNLIYDLSYGGNIGGWGMQFATPAEHHLVAHNTVCCTYTTGGKGAIVNKYGSASCSGTVIKNNILAAFTQTSAWTGAEFSNNIETGHTNLISYGGLPLYVDPSGDNYHLYSGSLAIYSGVNLGYIKDLDNVTLHDPPSVGCYEYV